MLKLENLTKIFGRPGDRHSVVAVDHINLEVPEGELFAFIGPNGAGKTTTIKMIAGLLKPTEGRVEVRGRDVQQDPIGAKKVLSYVPDQPYLYDKLTGREFLEFVAGIYELDRVEAKRKIGELSEVFDLSGYLDDLGETYSHGMKQRVVLSAAFLHDPEVIVVDEPMVGLDPKGGRAVKTALSRAAAAGTTVFMSTHTLSVAEEVAHRVGIIDKGRIIAEGTMADIRRLARTDGQLEEAFLRLTEGGSAD